ncbi:2-amino-4-hydroxy-6-hydroxymethyldihydropteridine diphosphokinase [Spirulina sp. 06S082]|nr:2-amino-4-hydroxy-6-hydroxymethyldihydropteridine diphosphokinase [Spirulina sp. 06S082]MEA5468810.1 2-amino-4-hydroxy-6-hydroxymethyldihydropteridine diphosphokinase [Spirulina sp. 06S082]
MSVSRSSHLCAIALGSNIGNSKQILNTAIALLSQTPKISLEKHSQWYRTQPIGPPQPDYLNGCAILKVEWTPPELLGILLKIEQRWGRKRREKWGPRSLDLDILFYGDRILQTSPLTIPHPHLRERAFVLVPLAEIAPHWVDPLTGKTVKDLRQKVDCSGVTLLTTPMLPGQEPPQLLKQRLAYQGRKFNFEVNRLRLPNDVEGDWECIRHPGGSLAVPVTSEGKLVLVRQYRFAICGRLLEFPAGTVEPHEDPAETIKREIEEETGYRAKTWNSLGKFPLAPGYSDEYIYAFLARDLEKLDNPPTQDEDEDIEVVLMTPQELEKTILTETASVDAKTIVSFNLARSWLE